MNSRARNVAPHWRALATALAAGALTVACTLSLTACAESDSVHAAGVSTAGAAAATAAPDQLPKGATPDYQLGGAYTPAAGVGIVGRDRSDPPAKGVYSICYVNGFQTQPGELESWPKSLLLQRGGKPVYDPAWPDEVILDTSTATARAGILKRVKPWIEQCAEDGYAAVEFDNLDTFERSHGALKQSHNAALAKSFVQVAHKAGLAAGQKNAPASAASLKKSAGFDFAVAESCGAYNECDFYTKAYGSQVIDIEYPEGLRDAGVTFAKVCKAQGTPKWMVLRDRDLTTPGSKGYTFEKCQ